MEVVILFNTNKFKKIAYKYETVDANKNSVNKIIIAGTKENLSIEDLQGLSLFLADYDILKDEFGVYNMFVTSKQIELYNNMNKKNEG